MKTFILMLSIFVSSYAFTAEENALPKVTEPIIAELNAAKAKAATEAIKKLQKVQGELTKKSDLEGAMAVKKYIDELQKSIDNLVSPVALFTKVEWGSDAKWVDVTTDITSLVVNNSLSITTLVGVLDETLRKKYTDPAPGSHKFLRFTFPNSKEKKTFPDDVPIKLQGK